MISIINMYSSICNHFKKLIRDLKKLSYNNISDWYLNNNWYLFDILIKSCVQHNVQYIRIVIFTNNLKFWHKYEVCFLMYDLESQSGYPPGFEPEVQIWEKSVLPLHYRYCPLPTNQVYKNCWNKSNFFKASITKKKLSINTMDQAVIQFQARIKQSCNYRTISLSF